MYDEMFEPGSWEPWAARPELKPICKSDEPFWTIQSNGEASCHGGWEFHWHHVQPGARHRIQIACESSGVSHVQEQLHAELTWYRENNSRANWYHIPFTSPEPGVQLFHHEHHAPDDAVRAALRVSLRWTDRGESVWTSPRLEPTSSPAERKLTAAIATGKFPGTSVDENVRFACELIGRAAGNGADVVCLPECISSWLVKDLSDKGARTIPGPESDRLCQTAANHGIDVVCSMNELNGKLIHNTGLYIDSSRGIIGKYRKVHLSVGERWNGVTPGVEFPVWRADYGNVGMLICYDNVMPEGHRILAQQGAEVVFLPIMGDPRAVGKQAKENWDRIMQVRAMDNHVWFVVCQNKGEWGVIVRPDGEIVARVDPSNGMAIAQIDLGFRFDSWIGSDFQNRYWGERRPGVYNRLTEDL